MFGSASMERPVFFDRVIYAMSGMQRAGEVFRKFVSKFLKFDVSRRSAIFDGAGRKLYCRAKGALGCLCHWRTFWYMVSKVN